MEKALLAYALLYPHYVIPGDITLPYKLGDRVSIVSVPNFGPAPGVVDELRGQVATEIREFGIHHCIAVECSIEGPRANRQALEEEQKADLKQQVIRAYLSLWLARPTLLAFRNLVFTEMQETDFLTLAIDQGNEPYVMPKDLRT